jgi:hypothetical protein
MNTFKTCKVICFTPQTYNSYFGWWKSLLNTSNTFLIVDNSSNAKIDYSGFIYNEDDIRKNFNFKETVNRNHYWNAQGNKNIIWFYAYLRMLNYYINNNKYDYYWFFDDDVYCNNWEHFLNSFEDDDSDFLSYFLFKNLNVESYPEIPKVDNKMFSGNLWFQRFPSHGDKLEPNTNDLFGSFFPIVRFSKRALEKLKELTLNDFHGYGEGFVPTTLAKYGYKINTIFNNENKSKYFDTNKINITHKNIKINWEWL